MFFLLENKNRLKNVNKNVMKNVRAEISVDLIVNNIEWRGPFQFIVYSDTNCIFVVKNHGVFLIRLKNEMFSSRFLYRWA